MTGDGSVIKLISRKMINFFGYYKETNHIGITSVGFERAAIFLSKKDFRVNKLYAFKGDEEINLLREGEEPSWITEDHYIEIHSLLEQNDHTPFSVLEIELINDGVINYYTGELYVKFPKGEDLKQKTMKLLETMGYYASEEIFEFCKENPDMYLLEFVLGMEAEDITDEFDRMKAHTEDLNNKYYSLK